MKISIISTSHRKNSESIRVSEIMKKIILKIDKDIKCYNLDMFKKKIPLWTSDKEKNSKFWDKEFKKISSELISSDGFIIIVPEYGGMATPNSKNFFLVFNNGELFHKPGLIISVSSGTGGAYPISELRSSSYKNSHIMWIPEHIIIRNVGQFNPGKHGELIPNWIDDRIKYCCNLLIKYCECLKPIQKFINRKDFGNGM
ncbi:MAG: hypothetical protein CBB97_07880 [Candidatus Endolissoclinum sp. TMED37]|nr:MAG: hypothetical protein CBB97_07880 [Candidatus Endolissoclinum sp. TMED37]|tara:strand:- start:1287 stop:1886 length:600 start_codon:yes stop_codon:yes gene_type:complete